MSSFPPEPPGPGAPWGPPGQPAPWGPAGQPAPWGQSSQPPPWGPPGQPAPWGPPAQPAQSGPPNGGLGPWGGYAPSPFAPPTIRRTHYGRLLVLLTVGLAVVGGIVAGASAWATPKHTNYACPPACGHPPTATPVSTRPIYVSRDQSYSVHYDPTGQSITSTTGSSGVTEKLTVGDGGVIRLFGVSASGRTAQQVASDLINQDFSGAQRAYQVPDAIVGFQPGYGEVDDVYPQSSGGSATHERLIIMVAVKNNVALVGEALGLYHPSAPGNANDDGHPTGASLEVAQLFDPLLNSFTWRGDPPR